MKRNYLRTKETKVDNQDRKARTRTIIQLGGLVDKAGLTGIFDIIPGEDLQSSPSSLEKAASLLGFLVVSHTTVTDDPTDFDKWRNIGRALLQKIGDSGR